MKKATPPSQSAEDDRTTSTGLARYAFEYIQAARLVDEDAEKRLTPRATSPIPAYFLAYHGIELSLKAYLRHRGLSPRALASKAYGHDLHSCYRKAKELGLLTVFKEHPDDKQALSLLADLNVNHGLRYIKTGAKVFPSWSIVDPLAVRLHQAVAPLVGFHSFTHSYPAYA
ncbi:hypothetical protein A3K87_29055 [Variovorax paradoxus]|uniref:HEPN domain-containing protein n=1 Tax=Variovorax paradoxus TaxID=34073 RepID=A0AA91DJZ3_VARPD|nr:hypothetical protein [Variovorax paradoxus]OAK58254.1 hypothetical protein A3K87_29055 [Variovorax paradoxus]